MSGLASGLKKVFKKVGTFVKTIAPIALIAGAAYFTGGFGLVGGGATAATATSAKAAIGAAEGASGGGLFANLGQWISGLFSGGGGAAGAAGAAGEVAGGAATGGGIGGFLSSPGGGMMAGSLLSGAASGYMAGQQQETQNQYEIDAENRRKASYEGAGAAASFRGNGLGAAPVMAAPTMAAPAMTTAPMPSTARPSVTTAAAPVAAPRYQYDPESRKIVYA